MYDEDDDSDGDDDDRRRFLAVAVTCVAAASLPQTQQPILLAACAHNQFIRAILSTARPRHVFDDAELAALRERENARQRLLQGLPEPLGPWRERFQVADLPSTGRIDPYEFFMGVGPFKFTESLRFTPEEFESLFEILRVELEQRLGHMQNVSLKGRLALVLFRMAHGTPFHMMESMFKIGRSALSDNYRSVLSVMEDELVKTLIQWPKTDELRNLEGTLGSEELTGRGNLGHCVLVVDATNLQISRPTYNQKSFYNNHKKMHSIKAQLVCTWRGEIVCVDYHDMECCDVRRGMPGGRHDTYYYANSLAEAHRKRTFEAHHRLLGDTGYPEFDEDRNVIMVIPDKLNAISSFTDNSQEVRKARNLKIGSVRVVVEGVIGAVKNLWSLYARKAPGATNLRQHARGFAVGCAMFNLLCRLRKTWPRGQGWMTGGDIQCNAWELAVRRLETDVQLDIQDAGVEGDCLPGGGEFASELMGASDDV